MAVPLIEIRLPMCDSFNFVMSMIYTLTIYQIYQVSIFIEHVLKINIWICIKLFLVIDKNIIFVTTLFASV